MMGRTDGHANGRMKSRRSIIKYCQKKRIWNDQFAFLGKYTFLFITISVLITVGVS